MAPEPMNWYQGVACLGTVALKGPSGGGNVYAIKIRGNKTSKVFKGRINIEMVLGRAKVKIFIGVDIKVDF